MSSAAALAPLNAPSWIVSFPPVKVTTDLLWSGSISTSSSLTPSTPLIEAAMESTTSLRRPSLKFGTHSTMRATARGDGRPDMSLPIVR